MSDHDGGYYDAHMNPWCLVRVTPADSVLFGYADRHPSTGGLAWTRSTPVLELDEAAGFAVTLSGRRYGLERRIEQRTVPEFGPEAVLAFRVLIGKMPDPSNADTLLDLDLTLALRWLTACKMARHLGVDCPDLMPVAVDAFFVVHASTYLRLRAM